MQKCVRRTQNIGKNIRKLRLKHNLSQEKVCEKLKHSGYPVSRSTYSNYENGNIKIRAGIIIALKKIYNCSYDDFFDGLED